MFSLRNIFSAALNNSEVIFSAVRWFHREKGHYKREYNVFILLGMFWVKIDTGLETVFSSSIRAHMLDGKNPVKLG